MHLVFIMTKLFKQHRGCHMLHSESLVLWVIIFSCFTHEIYRSTDLFFPVYFVVVYIFCLPGNFPNVMRNHMTVNKHDENNSKSDNNNNNNFFNAFSYQLQNAPTTLSCSVNGVLHCQQCESCKLQEKLTSIKPWFTSLSFNNQRIFLEELIVLSEEIAGKLVSIFSSLVSKDFHYSTSKLKYEAFGGDYDVDFTNHSLNIDKVTQYDNTS